MATFYTYDNIDQLTSENGGGIANSYTYDNNGNRLTKLSSGALTTYDYDGADKLLHAYLPGAVTRTYQYDNAGRTTVISGGGYNRTFTWNSDDRLTSLSGSNMPTTSYNYNAAGTRIWKSNSNGSRTYKRDGAGVTAPVLSDSVSTMVPGISERHSGVNKTIATDRLGSTKALIASGAITDTSEFDAFGIAVSRTGTTNTQKGFVGGAGYQEDTESGYKLLGHRYYDPESGRFLSRDSTRDGQNWYAYSSNNPLKAVDPSGNTIRNLTASERQDVQAAINDMRQNGEAAAADNLQTMLDGGRIMVDTEENGTEMESTGAGSNAMIYIHSATFDELHSYDHRRDQRMDHKANTLGRKRGAQIRFAGLLLHEWFHNYRQTGSYKWWNPWACEQAAWRYQHAFLQRFLNKCANRNLEMSTTYFSALNSAILEAMEECLGFIVFYARKVALRGY